MRSAPARRVLLACAAIGVACGNSDLLQGDTYSPTNILPIADPTERADDGGTIRDATALEAAPLPIGDAATAPTNTCENARTIGTISGDTSGPSTSASGTCSEWVSLRATEDSTGAAPMKVKLTLVPANFTLFVSYDRVRDVVTCGDPVQTTAISWGEATVANGSDDSRTIRIAIVKNGPCNDTMWTLTAEGNL